MGSYTNKTVLRGKPAGSTYIGRGRKDIAPLGYRLRNGSRMLYRQPAYLICTDPDLPLEKLLQYDLWRWGIEVNFREEACYVTKPGPGCFERVLSTTS